MTAVHEEEQIFSPAKRDSRGQRLHDVCKEKDAPRKDIRHNLTLKLKPWQTSLYLYVMFITAFQMLLQTRRITMATKTSPKVFRLYF